MDLKQVIVVSTILKPVELSDVIALETALAIKLPSGYTEFITTFGSGSYADLFYIFTPAEIAAQHRQVQASWRQYARQFFYDYGSQPLPETALYESIIVGVSHNGDEVVYHPSDQNQLYILPRHSNFISKVTNDFSDLHTWSINGKDHQRPKTFMAAFDAITWNWYAKDYTLTQEHWMSLLRTNWGEEHVHVIVRDADEWSWLNLCMVVSAGARFQLYHDEGKQRTINKDGKVFTVGGRGQRSLSLRVDCQSINTAAVEEFLHSIEGAGWASWYKIL